VAIGTSASAVTGTGNTAIGMGATINPAINGGKNQQVFGTTANSYTMPGINTTSTAAQVGPVNVVTADAAGTLGVSSFSVPVSGFASKDDVTNLQNQINNNLQNLQNQINNLQNEDRRLRAGIAMVAAIPHSVVLPNEVFALNLDWA